MWKSCTVYYLNNVEIKVLHYILNYVELSAMLYFKIIWKLGAALFKIIYEIMLSILF